MTEIKNMLELLSVPALWEVGRVYTNGSVKHGPRDWEKGLGYTETYGGLLRHLFKWAVGYGVDKEMRTNHMACVMWRAMALLHMELLPDQYKEFDDRPDYRAAIPNESSSGGGGEAVGVVETQKRIKDAVSSLAEDGYINKLCQCSVLARIYEVL